MSLESQLDRVEALLAGEDAGAAQEALVGLLDALKAGSPADRSAAVAAIAARVGHQDPHVGSYLGLLGGALLEAGAPAQPLALALCESLRRVVAAASRFLVLARQFAVLGEDPPADDDADPPADGDGVIEIGDLRLPASALDALATTDWFAARSFFSLEIWYRPAAAAWTRHLATLRDRQADREFCDGVAAIGGASSGGHWLGLLLGTAIDAPLVILLPELGEAYGLIMNGVVDTGQLSVLLSASLAAPLARIGASGPADEAMLAVMRGAGEQQVDASYSASFHLYSWQAMDPASGLPQDGRFEWRAPGGKGDHSLPPDFLPGTLEPLRGARVLLLVGPNTGGLRFVRVIGGSRMFSGLRAELRDVRRLGRDDTARWYDAVRAAAASAGKP
jgi:hypothetical protein